MQPILITGSHRSGTTWIGHIVRQSSKIHYINEPFNIEHPPGRGVFDASFDHWYTYIDSENEIKYYKPLKKAVSLSYSPISELAHSQSRKKYYKAFKEQAIFLKSRLLQKRVLLKDPLAFFSAEWMHEKIGTQNIVVVRHPAAFAGSLKRKEWSFDFSNLLNQKSLLNCLDASLRDDMLSMMSEPKGAIEQAILLWNIIHSRVEYYQSRYPEWYFIKHEDISQNPLEEFKRLFNYLDLSFTKPIQECVLKYSNSDNPVEAEQGITHTLKRNSQENIKSWKKRLSSQEIQKIYDGTRNISSKFYSDLDWE